VKNLLVFVPLLAAHQFSSNTLIKSGTAFLVFCLVASSAYVLNDLLDLSADKAHPRKRNRPFASGALSKLQGSILATVLLVSGLTLAAPLGGPLVLVVLCYCAVTIAYSAKLKRHSIIDVFTLAGLYTLRIIAGGAATGIGLSVWLLAFSIFFFLSLAAIKREAELVDMNRSGLVKASGRAYLVSDVSIIQNMATAAGYISVLVLALYINSPDVLKLYNHPYALWGICPILLYWVSRMVMIAHRGGMHDDPIVFTASDWVSHVCGLMIIAFALIAGI
jgi:4-hydroxybenzoate polyprenyltransferase